jgi:hypothetical protein
MQKGLLLRAAGVAGVALLLAACGEVNVRKYLPFGGDTATPERSRTPPNSIEYQCTGGKRFHLRTLDGGAAVWLILPEREVRLERFGSTGHYGKGNTVLELNGAAAVKDGATTIFADCKTGGGEAPATR